MNKFKADFSTNKLLLDIPEPQIVDYRNINKRLQWEKDYEAWKLRLSYSLSKELRDKLTDGQVIRADKFELAWTNGHVIVDNGDDFKSEELFEIAIPLPEAKNDGFIDWLTKTKEDKPDKLFTYDQMYEAVNRVTSSDYPIPHATLKLFIKENFGIEIKDNQPSNT